MNKLRTFQEFLTTQSIQVSVWGFVLNLIIAAFLAFILEKVYIKYGTSLSNRRLFAENFVLMTMTIMLIITIVKSSLALSLGLVGALSIVRFRAAIKEPEELSYLFLTIALGLGLGADQRLITIVAFIIIISILWARNLKHKTEEYENLLLTVTSKDPKQIDLEKVLEILKRNCAGVDLKRFDETKNAVEVSFIVEFDDVESLSRSKSELKDCGDSIKISFLDNRGVTEQL